MVVRGKGCDMMQIIYPPNEKKRRDCGLSYSPRKGTKNSRKEFRNPCPMTCRKKCQTRTLQNKRQEIFESFWKIGNVEGQWQFINSIITTIGKLRTQTNVNPEIKTTKQQGFQTRRERSM